MGAIKRRTSRGPKEGSTLRVAGSGSGASAERPRAPALAPADWGQLPATFTARLVALDERGGAWVQGPDAGSVGARPRSKARSARSTVALGPSHVGREVLVCRANHAGELVIVGVLSEPAAGEGAGQAGADASGNLDLVIERRRVVLSASTEVVLRCGEGSITLAADGKVTIRGVDVVSSAARTQRIRGGAVRIN